MNEHDLKAFEQARPKLLGLAYRMLGSRAEAEDAVQDVFVKWDEADRAAVDKPGAWLSTVCSRRCLDLLRAPHHKRIDYVGPWLPEPIQPVAPAGAEHMLAESLTTAFLLMLERLTPKERAAYLLHEIFDEPYPEIAAALEMEEPACRQLVSRAKANIDRDKVRHRVTAETQDSLLAAFQSALSSGNSATLASLLSSDIRITSDGGGKATAALRVLEGADALLFLRNAEKWWSPFTWAYVDMNGGRGAILSQNGQPMMTLSFGFDEEGRVNDIFVTRNPDKLGRLDPIVIQ